MNVPRVGVGALIIKDDKLLLGQRLGSHGRLTWAPPGGHLEFGETPEECAKREVLEETGLVLSHCVRGNWTNDYFKTEQKHYITLFMHSEIKSGTPEVKEPKKCKQWQWFSKTSLPDPLFLPLKHYLASGF